MPVVVSRVGASGHRRSVTIVDVMAIVLSLVRLLRFILRRLQIILAGEGAALLFVFLLPRLLFYLTFLRIKIEIDGPAHVLRGI